LSGLFERYLSARKELGGRIYSPRQTLGRAGLCEEALPFYPGSIDEYQSDMKAVGHLELDRNWLVISKYFFVSLVQLIGGRVRIVEIYHPRLLVASILSRSIVLMPHIACYSLIFDDPYHVHADGLMTIEEARYQQCLDGI
jgi:hypothetical protein